MRRTRPGSLATGLIAALWLTACTDSKELASSPVTKKITHSAATVARNPTRNAYFGDTHVHTRYSFDAYLMGTRTTPDDAYRFAKGAAIEHATGLELQLNKPLDFLAVTDHGIYLGAMAKAAESDDPISELEIGKIARNITSPADSANGFMAMGRYIAALKKEPGKPDLMDDKEAAQSAWSNIVAAAEQHNEPGTFTTFIGYEYTTGGPEAQNLHRNVIFRSANVPDTPFSRLESLNPEDLWSWMD
ncbi:MAG: DUF3604 domain-containing protein, partial [Pseudomonadales bacterium]